MKITSDRPARPLRDATATLAACCCLIILFGLFGISAAECQLAGQFPDQIPLGASGSAVRMGPPQSPFGYGNPSVKWPQRPGEPASVSVCWENPQPRDQQYRLIVSDSIEKTWTHGAAIEFTGWSA